MLDDPAFRIPTKALGFSVLHIVQTGYEAHQTPCSISTGGFLFQERKWPERDVELRLPSSADVKNDQSYTSVPSIRLHGVDGGLSFLVTTTRLKASVQPSYKTKDFSGVGRVEFQEDVSPLL